MTAKKKVAKKMAKPVKAWVRLSKDGKIDGLTFGYKRELICKSWLGDRIARVEIREVAK